jgi:hypothetical protein
MSLIDRIGDTSSILGGFLSDRLPHASAISAELATSLEVLPTLRPAEDAPHALLAKAILYRVRFHLAAPPTRTLPAWQFALRLGLSPGIQDTSVFEDLFDRLDTFLERIEPAGRRLELRNEEKLTRYCLVLARLETLGRTLAEAGRWPPGTETALDGLPEEWVRDVEAVSRNFHATRYLLTSHEVDVLPLLSGDELAGAEEDDLISGPRLVAVHTTTYPAVPEAWILRLVCHALLDLDDEHDLRAVSLYLSRQGHLISWNLEELVSRLSAGDHTVAELRHDLRHTLESTRRRRRISRLFRRKPRVTRSTHPDQLRLPFGRKTA